MAYLMISIRTFIASLFLLIFSVWSATAQGACTIDVSAIIERVNTECADLGENEVCYGNRNVNVTPRLNLGNFEFDSPGDLAELYNIQSLVVDAIDPTTDTWGVAQMRLLVGSNTGLQDMTMLLFGEFNIENAVEDTPTLDLMVQISQKQIYIAPNTDSALVETVSSGTFLTGLARLEDTSWIRVENPTTRRVGWVENSGIQPVEDSLSTGILPIQAGDSPYFGAMQAFYFQSGQTDLGCNTVESDGLLIQTPEGQARVSLLINEVSIELASGFNADGERESGTALIQANPLNGQDMTIDVLGGEATVETTEGSQEVTTGQQTSIPLTVDLRSPVGAPQEPSTSTVNPSNVVPLLPAVSAPRVASTNNGSGSGTNGTTTGNGSNNSNSGSGSGGLDLPVNTSGSNNNNNSGGNGSGNSTGNNTSSNNNNNSGNGFSFGGNNGNNNNNPADTTSSNGTFQNQNNDSNDDSDQFGFGQQGNTIALGSAISAMILFALYLIRSARSRH
ncbi:MAG: SH3 domain-containing protein [Chloroflexota bacterium]